MDILSKIGEVRARYKLVDLTAPDIMRCNLAFAMQMIVASEGLLRAGIAKLAPEAGAFEVDLLKYYVEHLEEETGHYEWLRDDLDGEEFGFHWGAAELAGMQYYLVEHVHPGTLLGYMLVLECFPMPLEQVEHLESIHGTRLLRTVRYHAVHDQDHGRDVLALVERAPDQLKGWIFENAIQTAHRIGRAQEQMGS
jgi:hypothetical protein